VDHLENKKIIYLVFIVEREVTIIYLVFIVEREVTF
jgi:hypothetical protein